MGRSGGLNRPNYLNHLDALLGDDFGLDRPERLVRDATVVQIRGTKPRDGSDRKRFRSGTSGRDNQPDGGTMQGRAIDTLGYRGMHSFEIVFDSWVVPADAVLGGEAGIGRGFYHQMAGFENGRLQTAARAVGVMQAAYEEARQYALDRVVFGQPISEYQLTQAKLGRMAVVIQAARQFAYD